MPLQIAGHWKKLWNCSFLVPALNVCSAQLSCGLLISVYVTDDSIACFHLKHSWNITLEGWCTMQVNSLSFVVMIGGQSVPTQPYGWQGAQMGLPVQLHTAIMKLWGQISSCCQLQTCHALCTNTPAVSLWRCLKPHGGGVP
jgi:hypothetical protein